MSIEFPQRINIPRQRLENARSESLPGVTAVVIMDPTVADEGINVLTRDLLQLGTKPLRARQLVLRLEDSLVLFQTTNVRVRARTELHSGMLAFVVFGPQARGSVNGLPIWPNLMLAVESGIKVEFIAESGYESVTVLLSPAVFVSHLTGRQRKGNLCTPHGIEVLHTEEVYARGLFDLGKHLANIAASHPELFKDRKETILAAQTELLEMLLVALDAANVPQLTFRDHTRQAYSLVVKLVEDYVLAHRGDRFYMKDLCIATGVRERTLEYVFQQVMGMSPVAYLTRLRLHRVRQALRMATHGSTTVSTQALSWGFSHFGDFARAYKDCFGELPSETLRRKQPETSGNPKTI